MREYCYIHKSWYNRIRGNKVSPAVCAAMVRSNLKRQMTRKEGIIFVDLMKRAETRRRTS